MKTVDQPAAYKFRRVSLDLALEVRRSDGLTHRRPQALSQSSELWGEGTPERNRDKYDAYFKHEIDS